MSTSTAWRRCGALLAVPLLALAACTNGDDGAAEDEPAETTTTIPFEWSGTAATVNGVEIPAQVISDQIEVFRAVPAALGPALGDVPELTQPGSEHPQPAIVADLLQTEILVQLIQEELAARGLAPTEDQLRIADSNLSAAFGSSIEELPESYVESLMLRYAEYIALDVALNPEPPEEELQAAYADEAQQEKWERSCARHILVTSDEDAQTALAQLAGGADFAEVARTRSQDTGTAPVGGELGCLIRGETGGAFEAALWTGPVGEVQGPITSEVGIHIVQVAFRGVPPYEDARELILADMRAEPFAQLGAWVTVRSVRSDIVVDPRFGTWDATVGQVKPVGGVPDGLTLTPGGGAPSSPTPSSPTPSSTATTAGVGVPTTLR